MFEHFDQKMVELRTTCEKRFEKRDPCYEWISILNAKVQDSRDKFDAISHNGSRDKRAVFDFIGNMAGDIFGIMDSRSKKQHMKDIKNLMANDEHLMNLFKNQTSVVEKTLNILQLNSEELKRQSEQFSNLTKRIEKTMDEYASASFFSDAVTHILHEILDFNTRIDVLLETIFDSRKHHVNHNLFPPKQLASELKIISEQVRNKFVVPEGNNVYNLISITPHISTNQILFHISIPLLEVDSFKIFRIISLPFTNKNQSWSIRPDHEYLIASGDRTRYQFLDFLKLQQCAKFGSDLICWGPYQWNMARVQTCEWNIFNEISNQNCTVVANQDVNVWHNVGENQWLFYSMAESDLTFICHDGVRREMIQGSGLLKFDQNCTVRNFDMEIRSRKSFNGRQISVLVPKIEKHHAHEIKWEKTLTPSNWSSTNIDELKKTIEIIRKNSSPTFQLNQHDIHHYSVLYVLIVAFIAFCTFSYFKLKKISTLSKVPVPSLGSGVPIALPRRISMPSIQVVAAESANETH